MDYFNLVNHHHRHRALRDLYDHHPANLYPHGDPYRRYPVQALALPNDCQTLLQSTLLLITITKEFFSLEQYTQFPLNYKIGDSINNNSVFPSCNTMVSAHG